MQPTSFDFWPDWLCYTTVIGVIETLFIFLPASVVLFLFLLARRELSKYFSRLAGLTAVLGVLLPIGGIFYVLWNQFIFGNLYITNDESSPDVDFSPFFPPTQTWLNSVHGYAPSMAFLDLVWLVFAATAWVMSFRIYKVLKRLLSSHSLVLA